MHTRGFSHYFAAGLIGLCSCTTPGCHSPDRDDEPPKPSAVASPRASKADQFTLQFEGAEALDFERHGDGFVIKSAGTKAWGTLKLDKDRVKLDQEGKETAKAKAKDYGFKVYDGDQELFKVKRKGSDYDVRRADDTPLGRFEAQAGRIGSEPVSLESTGDTSVLKRGGRTLVTVRGPLSASATLMLAVTEATLAQRLVMACIVQEGIAP